MEPTRDAAEASGPADDYLPGPIPILSRKAHEERILKAIRPYGITTMDAMHKEVDNMIKEAKKKAREEDEENERLALEVWNHNVAMGWAEMRKIIAETGEAVMFGIRFPKELFDEEPIIRKSRYVRLCNIILQTFHFRC